MFDVEQPRSFDDSLLDVPRNIDHDASDIHSLQRPPQQMLDSLQMLDSNRNVARIQ